MTRSGKGNKFNWLISFAAGGLLAWSYPGYAASIFTKIVDTNTPIPGGTGNFSFNGSDTPAVSATRVVFGTNNEDVWVARTDGTGLRRVISQGQVIPPGGLGTFNQYYGTYAQIHGNTVVVVGDNCGGCGSGVGIYARGLGSAAPITSLVDINTYLPGSTTDKFPRFPPDFDQSNDFVVFDNLQNVWAVPLAGGAVHGVAGNQDAGYSPPGAYCCIFDQPSVKGFRVLMRGGNGFGHASIQSVDVSGDPFSFRFVATAVTHPPGTPPGYRFDDFDFGRPLSDRGSVFYGDSAASSKPAIRGLYSRYFGLNKLADSNTPVPGGTGTFQFGWYGNISPVGAGSGIVVFGNIDAAGNPGIYAVSESGGAIAKIIARGDSIGGYTVQDLGFRRAGFDGKNLTFLVSYAGFLGTGIYATQVVLP